MTNIDTIQMIAFGACIMSMLAFMQYEKVDGYLIAIGIVVAISFGIATYPFN